MRRFSRIFRLAPLLALGACATPQTFAQRAPFSASRAAVFDAALQVLEERGEEMLKVDKARFFAVTEPKDWQIDDDLILHYRLTISVQERGPATRELVVYAQGDKRSSKTEKIFLVDDRDPQLVGVIEEVIAATAVKLNQSP